MAVIKAVTFDFWDTLVKDDSDEPKRAALGLPTKPQARLQLLVDEIVRYHPQIGVERIAEAFAEANRRFNRSWKEAHVTPTVDERLGVVYEALEILPTPGFEDVVRKVEEMEVIVPPDFAPEAEEALAELASEYALGIISDTIHTPGRGIRLLLRRQGLLPHFNCLIFSDEIGAAKPSRRVFEKAAEALGLPPARIVHVGDRESNDVEGPLAAGMSAVLFTGLVERGGGETRAHAVCSDFRALPAAIRRLG